MIVKCINVVSLREGELLINKKYKILHVDFDRFLIKNEYGTSEYYNEFMFNKI